MALDPTWPITDEAISFPTTLSTNVPFNNFYWVSVLNRTNNVSSGQSIQRGRQYELNTVQTGEYTPTLSNTDGALDPMNSGSPYAASMQPYSAYRKRAMFPPSKNLFNQFQASAGAVPGGLSTPTFGASVNSYSTQGVYTNGNAQFVNLATGGYNGYTCAMSAPATALDLPFIFGGFTVFPGQEHAFSFYCAQNTTGTGTMTVSSTITWANATGGTISTHTGTPVTLTAWSGAPNWQEVTSVATAPANACGALVGVTITAVGLGALFCGGAQYELASAPTSWTLPGVWY